MRKIDADALEEQLKQRAKNAERAGDGQAAGMFCCMVLILQHAPTLPEDDAGRDEQRSI